jgi:two-component system cell cycle response regulator DivK
METILVVEDDYLSRDALSRRLERSGYHVMRAVDGEQAIAMAHSATPDLILMDLGLPVLDGWQATRRLKADSATRDIPIIIVSAHVQPADRAMVLAAGGDDLDSKPVNFDELLLKIGTLLKRPH